MTNQRGFVLIEFVIALPLILMLLYGLAETTLQIYRLSKVQAADYVLAYEAQNVLTRITEDLRAASYVKRASAESGNNNDKIIINYHTIGNLKNQSKIADVIDTRVYNVADYKIYAKRQDDKNFKNPITGDTFFGKTSVTQLKFSKPAENVVHITLEMESQVTNDRIKFSTAVFMPACKNMEGF